MVEVGWRRGGEKLNAGETSKGVLWVILKETLRYWALGDFGNSNMKKLKSSGEETKKLWERMLKV